MTEKKTPPKKEVGKKPADDEIIITPIEEEKGPWGTNPPPKPT